MSLIIKMNKNFIFKVKIICLLYILFVNIFPNKLYLQPLNYNLSKFFQLIVITLTSFYDITLGILLTVILIMNIIIYETNTVKEAKTIVITNEIKDNQKEQKNEITISKDPIINDTLPENKIIVNDFNNKILDDKHNYSESNKIAKEQTISITDDENMYTNNIHNSLSKELVPDTTLMTDMQSNIYDTTNNNKSISPLKDLYKSDTILAYEPTKY